MSLFAYNSSLVHFPQTKDIKQFIKLNDYKDIIIKINEYIKFVKHNTIYYSIPNLLPLYYYVYLNICMHESSHRYIFVSVVHKYQIIYHILYYVKVNYYIYLNN